MIMIFLFKELILSFIMNVFQLFDILSCVRLFDRVDTNGRKQVDGRGFIFKLFLVSL